MSFQNRPLQLLRRKYAFNTTNRPLMPLLSPVITRGVNNRRFVMDDRNLPYDPDSDPTPRRKYVFGGALLIAVAVAVVSSIARGKPARADTADDTIIQKFMKDPATDVEFPTTLELPGTPPLKLLGLGVRTVSFLGLKVYSVGFYADLNQPGYLFISVAKNIVHPPHAGYDVATFIDRYCFLLVPVRSTSHTHLRDGFIRAIQGRISLAQKNGLLTPEEEDSLIQPIQTLKGLFPNVSLPKHKPLHVVLTAPAKATHSRTLYFPELGQLEDSWVANE
ncbi:hypothetical protein FRC17_006546 [Serendipita sp. 399]|nr:hypothetical protein FRC17_006546 [Serendipita sp. 399]